MQWSALIRNLVLPAALAFGWLASAQAVDFPTRPVRFVHPLAPGSPADAYWRTIAAMLSKKWGQPVIMENRPGAGGVVAVESVLAAPPDGHTLYLAGTTTVSLGMFNRISFDPLKDLQLVAMTYTADIVVATSSHVPVKNLAEFVAYAKANPGKLNYASLGKNSVMVYLEWFKRATGTDLTEIPYKGTAEQLDAMMRNDVHLIFIQARSVKSHIDAGRLKPLFVIAPERLRDMPDVPTNAEAGLPDYRPPQWSAFMASSRVPKDIIEKIRADMAPIITSPELEPVLYSTGNRAFKGTYAQGDELFRYTTNVLSGLVKDLNIKPD